MIRYSNGLKFTKKPKNSQKISLKSSCFSHGNRGMNLEQVKKDVDRDKWLSAEEALNYGEFGLIDKIIDKSK